MSARLERWIRDAYPGISADAVLRELGSLGSGESGRRFESERVLAAVAVMGAGDIIRFREAVDLVMSDWRDVLVAAGLADEGWRSSLDEVLGPDPQA